MWCEIIQVLFVTHPKDEIKEKEQVFDTFRSTFYSHDAFQLNPVEKLR